MNKTTQEKQELVLAIKQKEKIDTLTKGTNIDPGTLKTPGKKWAFAQYGKRFIKDQKMLCQLMAAKGGVAAIAWTVTSLIIPALTLPFLTGAAVVAGCGALITLSGYVGYIATKGLVNSFKEMHHAVKGDKEEWICKKNNLEKEQSNIMLSDTETALFKRLHASKIWQKVERSRFMKKVRRSKTWRKTRNSKAWKYTQSLTREHDIILNTVAVPSSVLTVGLGVTVFATQLAVLPFVATAMLGTAIVAYGTYATISTARSLVGSVKDLKNRVLRKTDKETTKNKPKEQQEEFKYPTPEQEKPSKINEVSVAPSFKKATNDNKETKKPANNDIKKTPRQKHKK